MKDEEENACAPYSTDTQASDTRNGMHDAIILAYTGGNAENCTNNATTDAKDADEYETPSEKSRVLEPPERGSKSNRFRHELVGGRLIQKYHVCHVGNIRGPLAIWNKEEAAQYQTDESAIRRVLSSREENPGITITQKREVLDYLKDRAPVKEEADPRCIQFRNQVINKMDFTFQPPTPDILVTNTIPHNYIAEKDTTEAETFLDTLACHDPEIFCNLCEVIGVCMWRGRFSQCAMLIGSGANGKSTFIEALKNVLGPDNYSNLEIASFSEHFQIADLEGKLANFDDDMPSNTLKGEPLSVLKKVITGEEVRTDTKFGMPHSFRPKATIVLSANEVPRFGDSTPGMQRRLFAIPFNAKFTPDMYDPKVLEWARSENAAEQLIVLGLRALRELNGRTTFTPNKFSNQMIEDIMQYSDSVRQFFVEEITPESINLKPVKETIYRQYVTFCEQEGIKFPLQQKQFTPKLMALCKEHGFPVTIQARPCAFLQGKKVRTFIVICDTNDEER